MFFSLLGAASALSTPSVGFTFSPGGLLFPYYVGAGYELQRAGLLTQKTPLGGSSAGSIVATALACGIAEETVLAGLAQLVEHVRGGMRLNKALRSVLRELCPEDAHEVAAEHGLTVCYLSIFPWPSAQLVTEWESKEDLIDTVCASCNWPLFFSRWPFVWCRGNLALDGFLALPRRRFGCPPLQPSPARTIALTCLPKVSLEEFAERDTIQPGAGSYDLPYEASSWFEWALKPADDQTLEEMAALGRAHAAQWVEREAAEARSSVSEVSEDDERD